MNEDQKYGDKLFIPISYKEKINQNKELKELKALTGTWALLGDKIDLNNTEIVSNMLDILNYENSMFKEKYEKFKRQNIFLWITLIIITIGIFIYIK